jgi:hypothetical protein
MTRPKGKHIAIVKLSLSGPCFSQQCETANKPRKISLNIVAFWQKK